MSAVLICNVGTREIQLADPTVLPTEVCDTRSNPLARLAGAYLRDAAVFARLKDQIRLPMIEKALPFVAPGPKQDVQIMLFATDQPETVAGRYRDQDTIIYAEIIRDVLFDRYQPDGLIKKQIRIMRITEHSPADYDQMYDYYQAKLPEVHRQIAADAVVSLLIAGGTPQMNTMLLFVGSEVFGRQARPLYVSPERDRALPLDIGRQLYTQALRRNLAALLDAYAYGPAMEVLRREEGSLATEQAAMLGGVLEYAQRRRNLDLGGAVASLDLVYTMARTLRPTIEALREDVTQDTEPVKLRETIYLAQIAAESESWADFLARLHRFSEGGLQHMAEQFGVEWGARDRASYKEHWWNAQRALLAQLQLADAIPPADPGSESHRREVNRTNLRQIVERLAKDEGRADALGALKDLKVIDGPIPLRNAIVHRFQPISRKEVEDKAGVTVEAVIAHMRAAYQAIFGMAVDATHPYRQINDLCRRILTGER